MYYLDVRLIFPSHFNQFFRVQRARKNFMWSYWSMKRALIIYSIYGRSFSLCSIQNMLPLIL